MTAEERRANDRRIASRIRELEKMAHQSPFFSELLEDLKVLKARLDDANGSLAAVSGLVFGSVYADSDGCPVVDAGTKVMMYNRNILTEDEAARILGSERFTDPRVVVMNLEEARNLFPYLSIDETQEDGNGKE